MADSPAAGPSRKRRVEASTKYAIYSLADALAVATAIHQRGGGEASVDELAAFLGYRSANNGAFYDRLSATRMFGLMQGQGAKITLTNRATDIVMPVFPEQAAKGKIDAFLAVPLFGKLYEEFQGKQLPPEAGLKNLMRTKYGVPPSRVDSAYRAMVQSAEQAGFFSTRGTKTQLIVPRIRQIAGEPTDETDLEGERGDDENVGDQPNGTGHQSGSRRGSAAPSLDTLKATYVATLIEMLSKKDEPDLELMSKIEKLLGMTEVES